MNENWEMVKQFHLKFNHPVGLQPKTLDSNRVSIRTKWLIEEIGEFTNAGTIEKQADAMIDLIYFALGVLVEMGIQPDKLFEIVHEANMKKCSSLGEILYDKYGKVLKPVDWISPNDKIKEEIMKQKGL